MAQRLATARRPANVEQAYLAVLNELGFPNPVVSSATEKKAELSGESGVKMRGPYDWVPPVYWYTDTKLGGPHGFATEIGPGPAPPPLESLKPLHPRRRPVADQRDLELSLRRRSLQGPRSVFNAALDARYGPSASVEEYARKAQVAAYESHRAMLESFGARKYVADRRHPVDAQQRLAGMIWHLYDFYLRPGGSYFGAKKACEPLHVQYSYDDRSVRRRQLDAQRRTPGLEATARVVDARRRRAGEPATRGWTSAPDGVAHALELPALDGARRHVLRVPDPRDAAGRTVSRNVYWLSSEARDPRPGTSRSGTYTPVAQYADLTALQQLPPAERARRRRASRRTGPGGRARVALENPLAGARVLRARERAARQRRARRCCRCCGTTTTSRCCPARRASSSATYATKHLAGTPPAVAVDGWNVAARAAR